MIVNDTVILLSKANRLLRFFFLHYLYSILVLTSLSQYNPPYEVKAIPGSNSISINFWSGVLANDFAGFNLYAKENDSSLTQADAISNLTIPLYPTVPFETHTRSNITLTFSNINLSTTWYENGKLYYVGVTAYGTNDLAEGGKIETKVNAIPVVPREETGAPITGNSITITGITPQFTANISGNTITAQGWQIRSCGQPSNFNAITVFTNSSLSTDSAPYTVGSLYIFSNGNNLVKLWITNGGYLSATHTQAVNCPTI